MHKQLIGGRFATLPESPFARLRRALEGIAPGKPEISLALGEPRHAPPDFVLAALQQAKGYDRYPPIAGLPVLRDSISAWLQRRFSVTTTLIDPETQILPLNGTREGLFLAAQLAPEKPDGTVAMPNPFYQVYAAAGLGIGAQPEYLPATAMTGFLPDLGALDPGFWRQCRAFYICSPANPQGAVADRAYLRHLVEKALEHNFLLLVDECYSEIYDRALEQAPPPSVLEVIRPDEIDRAPVIAFHSLSKRSNLPGLRAGFCAGGRHVMEKFGHLRQIAGPQSPLIAQEAAALAWQDDAHVALNRSLYHAKLDDAERLLDGQFGFYRPAGGFFLWLNVGDGEAAAKYLWQTQGLRVLPGAYLSRPDHGKDPCGGPYIRVALVSAREETEAALTRLKDGLSHFVDERGAA